MSRSRAGIPAARASAAARALAALAALAALWVALAAGVPGVRAQEPEPPAAPTETAAGAPAPAATPAEPLTPEAPPPATPAPAEGAPAGPGERRVPAAPAGLVGLDLASPIEPYKLNYVLPYALDFERHPGRQEKELKFQISLKKQLVAGWPFYFAYSQQSFWQVYDQHESRPFRETNYNPELFFDFVRPLESLPDLHLQSGIEHESNGQAPALSRSWNRVYLWPRYDLAPAQIAFKYWYRLPEEKQEEGEPPADENPNIEHFLGRFELHLRWRPAAAHELRLMARKGNADPDGTYRLDYLYVLGDPRGGRFLMLQYFRGFGESLIDYNERVNKVGIGVAFE